MSFKELIEVNNLLRTIEHEYPVKKDLFLNNKFSEYVDFQDFQKKLEPSKIAFTRYLHETCNAIDNQFKRLYKSIETQKTPVPVNKFDRLISKYTKLKDILTLFENELLSLERPLRDYELQDFYDDVDDELEDIYNITNPSEIQLNSLYEFKNRIESKFFSINATSNIKPETSIEKSFSFRNNFDSIEELKVFNYFTTKLVDSKYLNDEILKQFLKYAFELKNPPNSKFSFENITTKQKIIKVFYDYYKVIALKPHGRQQQYAELLGEYFHGFESKSVKANFNK